MAEYFPQTHIHIHTYTHTKGKKLALSVGKKKKVVPFGRTTRTKCSINCPGLLVAHTLPASMCVSVYMGNV